MYYIDIDVDVDTDTDTDIDIVYFCLTRMYVCTYVLTYVRMFGYPDTDTTLLLGTMSPQDGPKVFRCRDWGGFQGFRLLGLGGWKEGTWLHGRTRLLLPF